MDANAAVNARMHMLAAVLAMAPTPEAAQGVLRVSRELKERGDLPTKVIMEKMALLLLDGLQSGVWPPARQIKPLPVGV